jgi:peptidoglycan/LPS O-acetylase OafA/YrhL
MNIFSPPSPAPTPHHYRPEIDGLRALAVVLVMLFHAGFSSFAGGYIGVDVFFVISGYLITSIIVRERMEGKFSILRFYERRIRRIFPALFFIIACILPFAWFFLLPDEMKAFGQSLVSVVFFASNIYFENTHDYFARESTEIPLLHTWSLGVEEQYYVFFPLALMVLWRYGIEKIIKIFAVLIIVSLPVNEILGRDDPEANFFLMPPRAWELLVGALIALLPYAGWNFSLSTRKATALSVLGIVLILTPAFLYTEDNVVFPGLAALPPVLGTAFILAFARENIITARVLAVPPLVALGLVSYSAYLWHQPVFVFSRFASAESISDGEYAALIVLSFVLAGLSWRFVEQPFRKPNVLKRKQVFASALLVSLAALICGAALWLNDGFKSRFPEHVYPLLEQSDLDKGKAYSEGEFAKIEDADFQSNGKKKLLVIGDSYSKDFINALHERGLSDQYQLSAFYIPAKCQIYVGPENPYKFIDKKNHGFCHKRRNLDSIKDKITEADVIVIGASWENWSAERLPQTINSLNLKPEQKLYVLGRKWLKRPNIRKYARAELSERLGVRHEIPSKNTALNELIKKSLPEGTFIDMNNAICGPENMCPIFTPEGDLISYDGSHLTQPGAVYVSKLLFEKTPLSELN